MVSKSINKKIINSKNSKIRAFLNRNYYKCMFFKFHIFCCVNERPESQSENVA